MTSEMRTIAMAQLNSYLAENTWWRRFISFSWDRWFNHNVALVQQLRDDLAVYEGIDSAYILNKLHNQNRYSDVLDAHSVYIFPVNVDVQRLSRPERIVSRIYRTFLPVTRSWNEAGKVWLNNLWNLFINSPDNAPSLSFAIYSKASEDSISRLIEQLVANPDGKASEDSISRLIEQLMVNPDGKNIDHLAKALDVYALGDDMADYEEYFGSLFSGYMDTARYRKLGETRYANLPVVGLILNGIENLSPLQRMEILKPAMDRMLAATNTPEWLHDRAAQIEQINDAYLQAKMEAQELSFDEEYTRDCDALKRLISIDKQLLPAPEKIIEAMKHGSYKARAELLTDHKDLAKLFIDHFILNPDNQEDGIALLLANTRNPGFFCPESSAVEDLVENFFKPLSFECKLKVIDRSFSNGVSTSQAASSSSASSSLDSLFHDPHRNNTYRILFLKTGRYNMSASHFLGNMIEADELNALFDNKDYLSRIANDKDPVRLELLEKALDYIINHSDTLEDVEQIRQLFGLKFGDKNSINLLGYGFSKLKDDAKQLTAFLNVFDKLDSQSQAALLSEKVNKGQSALVLASGGACAKRIRDIANKAGIKFTVTKNYGNDRNIIFRQESGIDASNSVPNQQNQERPAAN